MPASVLVIGLDGADPDLLERYCDDGRCPAIARLRSGGQYLSIKNPIGWSDDAVWASFATGEGIGIHGRYHGPDQHYPGVYGPQPFTRRPFEASTFWGRLDARGRACAIMDVPKSPLSRDMQHSRQLSDWLVHGRDHPHPVSVPWGWADEILTRHGPAPRSPCSTYAFQHGVALHDGFSDAEADHWIDTLIGSVGQKARAAQDVLINGTWDLSVVVFKEIHCASHLFWGDTVRLGNVYATLDQQVQGVIDAAGPTASVVLFAPHGMRDSHTATPVLAPLVQRFNQDKRRGIAKARFRALSLVARALGRQLGEAHDHARAVIHNEAGGAVRFNVRGREPLGKVAPGAEYQALLDEFSSVLLDLQDDETGAPVVAEVIRPQQRDAGPKAANLPDLLAIWSNDHPVSRVRSERFGLLEMPLQKPRKGNHTNRGFCISSGLDLRPAGPAVHDLSRAIEAAFS